MAQSGRLVRDGRVLADGGRVLAHGDVQHMGPHPHSTLMALSGRLVLASGTLALQQRNE
jgi:hypothetical protein